MLSHLNAKTLLFVVAVLLVAIVLIVLSVTMGANGNSQTASVDLNTELSIAADRAMKTDCWREGGHGSGQAIASFNEKLPAELAALLEKPEARTMPLSKIEASFQITGGNSIDLALTMGDADHLLAEFTPLYCEIGSHDQPARGLSVVDYSGHYWQLDHDDVGSQHLQWVDHMWIGIIDLFPLANGMGGGDQSLWIIARQGDGWAVVNKWPPYFIGNERYQFENGTANLTVSLTQQGAAPCPAIARLPGYESTMTNTISTYRWDMDHYVLVTAGPLKPVSVYFELSQGVVPTPGSVEITPFYGSDKTLLAYSIDQWEALCKPDATP